MHFPTTTTILTTILALTSHALAQTSTSSPTPASTPTAAASLISIAKSLDSAYLHLPTAAPALTSALISLGSVAQSLTGDAAWPTAASLLSTDAAYRSQDRAAASAIIDIATSVLAALPTAEQGPFRSQLASIESVASYTPSGAVAPRAMGVVGGVEGWVLVGVLGVAALL